MTGSAPPAFDPSAHRMVPEQRWFEDFRLGERFPLRGRTMHDQHGVLVLDGRPRCLLRKRPA
jgi:hypothetical protein